MKDIKQWYPFVKGHGVLCGDDYSWGDGGVGRAVEQFAKDNGLKVFTDYTFWKYYWNDPLWINLFIIHLTIWIFSKLLSEQISQKSQILKSE